MSESPDEPQISPPSRAPLWGIYIAVGTVLYVLSIGPAFWLWFDAENLAGSPLVRLFYLPLRLACYSESFESWLNRYINWWIT